MRDDAGLLNQRPAPVVARIDQAHHLVCGAATVDDAAEYIPFLRIVEAHSTSSIDLAFAARARTSHIFWLADTLDGASGSTARALVDLDRFNDLLNEVLGGVAVMEKANLLASKVRRAHLENRTELENALIKTGAGVWGRPDRSSRVEAGRLAPVGASVLAARRLRRTARHRDREPDQSPHASSPHSKVRSS